jgi:hypothetical protein
MTFAPLVLEALRVKREIDVETASASGAVHTVTIWVVVVGDIPYVRSVRGEKGRWFRELVARGGALHVGARRVPVRAELVSDAGTNAQISDAFEQKYERPRASVVAMIRPEVLATTARLYPASP